MATKKKTEEKKGPVIQAEKFTRELHCVLGNAEIADRADRAANLSHKAEQRAEALKEFAKEERRQCRLMKSESRELMTAVRTKSEVREIELERRLNFTEKRVTEVRLDTGEVVLDREMSPQESQRQLFDPSLPGSGSLEDEFEE